MMIAVTAGCLTAVVGTAVQQIADHGWKAFVFRAPGVGATHDHHGQARVTGHR
jgi:hypothetical protein